MWFAALGKCHHIQGCVTHITVRPTPFHISSMSSIEIYIDVVHMLRRGTPTAPADAVCLLTHFHQNNTLVVLCVTLSCRRNGWVTHRIIVCLVGTLVKLLWCLVLLLPFIIIIIIIDIMAAPNLTPISQRPHVPPSHSITPISLWHLINDGQTDALLSSLMMMSMRFTKLLFTRTMITTSRTEIH